jgi:drug/metabolite transporter (DMT)-like permease
VTSPRSDKGGIAWALVAVGLFALTYLAGKFVAGASALEIMWLRYVGGLVTVIVWVLGTGNPHLIGSRQVHVHVLRAAAGAGTGSAAIYAASHMRVADATAIGLLDGFFTIVLGVFVHREIVSLRHWGAALLCLIGAVIVVAGKGVILRLDDQTFFPAVVALGGAVLAAVEYILIKGLARSENTVSVLFYVNLFGALLLGLPALFAWSGQSWLHLAFFLSLGPVAILGQTCNIRALRLTDAAVIGPVRYSWLVFGALYGWLFFGERPNIATYVGGAVILAGGLWLGSLKQPPAAGRGAR